MAISGAGAPVSLQIRKTFRHPREKVFRAWVDPEALARWFGPTDEYRVLVPTFQPRVGGRYLIEMHHSGGNVHRVSGVFRAIEHPARLVYTWAWEGRPEAGETLVTVEFTERGNETDLVLTHEKFTSEESRENHSKGWNGCLGRLEAAL